MNKKDVINQICIAIKSQLLEIENELSDLKVELENDTKSSAGDKFETSREMMAQEYRRLQEQIQYKTSLIQKLNELPLTKEDAIDYGSLIQLNKDHVLLGVGAGKFHLNNQTYMCLSLNSPLGKLLIGKVVGESINFNNNTFTIQSIA